MLCVCGSRWNVDTNHLKEIDSQIVFVLHVFSGSSLVAISVACHHGEMSQDRLRAHCAVERKMLLWEMQIEIEEDDVEKS